MIKAREKAMDTMLVMAIPMAKRAIVPALLLKR